MTCYNCGEILHGRQSKFCSLSCLNANRGKKKGKNTCQINCFCQWCGINYTKKKSQWKRSKFCSKSCQGYFQIDQRKKRKEKREAK